MTALITPIEVPITPSGCIQTSVQRLVDTDLVGAQRAPALQHQHDLFSAGFNSHVAGAAAETSLRLSCSYVIPASPL